MAITLISLIMGETLKNLINLGDKSRNSSSTSVTTSVTAPVTSQADSTASETFTSPASASVSSEDDWRGQNTLKLKFTNASDAGNFDCQVSTNPKISQIFKLNIIVPSVSVEGEKEKHVMAGSPVQLKCFIRNCLKQPTYVFWYLSGSRLLDTSGHVKVRTSMQPSGKTALSVLSIDSVSLLDRGNYTCRPASGGEASISLHVLEGEKPAGLQHDQTSAASRDIFSRDLIQLLLLTSSSAIAAILSV